MESLSIASIILIIGGIIFIGYGFTLAFNDEVPHGVAWVMGGIVLFFFSFSFILQAQTEKTQISAHKKQIETLHPNQIKLIAESEIPDYDFVVELINGKVIEYKVEDGELFFLKERK